AQAGRPGAVTIATNMAGRGTDIQLGGNLEMRLLDELDGIDDPAKRQKKEDQIREELRRDREKVVEAGGLYVLATERHESRRIDNQLRGRSGRQGDPGTSKFFLSLEDDLMRIFGSERMDGMLQRLGLEEGEAITHPWINRALEKAQRRVEQRNFEIRKNLLKFDDVMNDQRKAIYEQRRELMQAEDISDTIADMRHEAVEEITDLRIPPKSFPEQWDIEGLKVDFQRVFNIEAPIEEWIAEDGLGDDDIRHRLRELADKKMAERAVNYGPQIMRALEKSMLLQTLDQQWKDHLLQLDHLRQTVSLRAYGQRDPLNEFKSEAFDMFSAMLARVREECTMMLARVELRFEDSAEVLKQREEPEQKMVASHTDPFTGENDAVPATDSDGQRRTRMTEEERDPNDPATWGKVPRNAPCPCGSGKKYKHCHGAVAVS
ncbi:MAG: SEC-C metal-binding domain-containing protein, partial [Alphaproteobacteria bacterium]|nr:SEC-C metal-binding domain-containing protein [Alphaproteobacteria bacterium]